MIYIKKGEICKGGIHEVNTYTKKQNKNKYRNKIFIN